MNNTPRIYIAAIKKSSGKTTITIGLNRIFKEMKLTVQPFKKGPDFIDPIWHTQAAKRPCRNLDFFFLKKEELLKYFTEKSKGSDIVVIEGNHGLFDDIKPEGGTDNASLAKLTKTPVILVLDVKEMGRSVVPIIIGCQEFDKDLKISGIILNKVQNERQKNKIVAAIKKYTKLPVVGAIPEYEGIGITQRHLGLSATMKQPEREATISNIAAYIKKFLKIKEILKIAQSSEALPNSENQKPEKKRKYPVKIAIAFDEAFNFYYPDNLEQLESMGATLHYFSPLRDKLPESDGIYIGGGFPELFLKELEENSCLGKSLKTAIQNCKPVYAECGGLIFLVNKVFYEGKEANMIGAINSTVIFQKKPVGHGYTLLKSKINGWWSHSGKALKGHEFHHARVLNIENECAFEVQRGYGINGKCDGAIVKNTLASFTHIWSPANPEFFRNWIKSIYTNKKIQR